MRWIRERPTPASNALDGQPAGTPKSGGSVCTPGGNFETLTAKLDASGYDVGSGFFDLTSARIMDGYATADLKCTVHTLGGDRLRGVLGSEIVEVTTTTADGLTASYARLKGHLVKMHTPPWACTVK